MLLWHLVLGREVYHNIIYRQKYFTYFVNAGIKLLNIEMKETKPTMDIQAILLNILAFTFIWFAIPVMMSIIL